MPAYTVVATDKGKSLDISDEVFPTFKEAVAAVVKAVEAYDGTFEQYVDVLAINDASDGTMVSSYFSVAGYQYISQESRELRYREDLVSLDEILDEVETRSPKRFFRW